MIIIVLLLIIVVLTTITAIFFGLYFIRNKKENKINNETQEIIMNILDNKYFHPEEVLVVDNHLSLAINKTNTKLAVINNFNPEYPQNFHYFEIGVSFIEKIEKKPNLKIYFIQKGVLESLTISSNSKEAKNFIHKIFFRGCLKKIEAKYPNNIFDVLSPSDWECSYVWAYSSNNDTFAYFRTGEHYSINKISLRREFFTLDTKYKYFEAPIFSMTQQLYAYNENFFNSLLDNLFYELKEKCNVISKDTIYYDSYNNVIYISNGYNSLQSIILNKIEEVNYEENRIIFKIKDSDRTISFIANSQLINDFGDFLTNYNLKKIAECFDNQYDKLINTTQNTKLIIDFTRERLIYCANLNRLASFNYIIVSFDNLYDLQIEKYNMRHFLRIITKDKNIIDVTCDKKEVAQYIQAQVFNNVFE